MIKRPSRGCLPLLLLALSATGCSLIPDFPTPPPPVPAAWTDDVWAHRPEAQPATTQQGTDAATSDGRPILPPMTEGSWRQFFTDPSLQQAIAVALDNNRDLAASLGRVEEARAQAGLASSGLWPNVELAAQRNAVHTPVTVRSNQNQNAATGKDGTTTQRYDVNLATSYELDFWGRVRSLDSAARATFLATEYAHQAFRINLIADVANAWYALEDLQQREYLLTLTEATRQTSLDLVRKRRDVGLSSDLELTVAEAGYHSVKSDRLNTTRLRLHAENALRVYLGRELEAATRPTLIRDSAMPPLPTFAHVTVNLPAEAILRRPDVRAAEQKLTVARANIGAARAAFLPRIVLTATAGTASSALSGLFAAGSGAWTFIPALHLPLFDAGRYGSELDVAKAREHVAVADYERTLQNAFREIANALATAKYGWLVVTEMYESAEAQLRRLKLVEARHQAGVSNYLELLDAQRDALTAQQSQATARYGVQTSATAFFRAVGGL